MTQAVTSNPLEATLEAILEGMRKEDYEETQRSLIELTSQKNAYTGMKPWEEQRWNMITYKKGQKSSL
jgi:hypothetical protein